MSLNDCDHLLIVEIAQHLEPRDLVAFTIANKHIYTSFSDRFWQHKFLQDFGRHAESARRPLVSHRPEITWRAVYRICLDRRLFVWDNISGPGHSSTVQEGTGNKCHWYSKFHCTLATPQELHLPRDVIPRTVGFLHDAFYVLTLQGEINRFRANMGDPFQFTIAIEPILAHISDKPRSPFTEIAVIKDAVIAVTARGDWWLWKNSGSYAWQSLFENTPIWPDTLSSNGTEAFALSKCGRYAYAAEHNERKFKLEIPDLVTGPPLTSITSFVVENDVYRSPGSRYGPTACLQINRRCYVLFVFDEYTVDSIPEIALDSRVGEYHLNNPASDGFKVTILDGKIIRILECEREFRSGDLVGDFKDIWPGVCVNGSCSRKTRTVAWSYI